MGLFSSIFGGAKELNRIANGVANITNFLDEYEIDNDLTYLYTSAWICRISVLDIVERNQYPMTYKLYASMHGHYQRMTIMESYMLTISRIMNKAEERGDVVKKNVQEILDRGNTFFEIDKQIPNKLRQIFK